MASVIGPTITLSGAAHQPLPVDPFPAAIAYKHHMDKSLLVAMDPDDCYGCSIDRAFCCAVFPCFLLCCQWLMCSTTAAGGAGELQKPHSTDKKNWKPVLHQRNTRSSHVNEKPNSTWTKKSSAYCSCKQSVWWWGSLTHFAAL